MFPLCARCAKCFAAPHPWCPGFMRISSPGTRTANIHQPSFTCWFPKMGVPQIIHFNRVFPYTANQCKSTIFGYTHMSPYDVIFFWQIPTTNQHQCLPWIPHGKMFMCNGILAPAPSKWLNTNTWTNQTRVYAESMTSNKKIWFLKDGNWYVWSSKYTN